MTDRLDDAILRRMRSLVWIIVFSLAATTSGAAQIVQSQPTNIISSSGGHYELVPGDVLRVDVWGRAEYSGMFQVNEEGFIYYPILGEMDTKGTTVGQVRQMLLEGLQQLFTNPFVTVTPLFRVSVIGFVQRPGLYTVDPTLSILDIVALAGGPTPTANTKRIRVLRPGAPEELSYEGEAVAGRTLQEIGVRSGDDIIVPRKFFAREDWLIVLQALNLIITIAIFANTVR